MDCRPSLEREVQRDVRIHSSSCGTHRAVVHSPFEWLYHRSTAAVVTTCASSADCLGSAAPMCCGGVCVAMSCGGGSFPPDGTYDSVWDSVRLMTGKYTVNYFQYQEDVGCVCMLNDWFSCYDEICADNYNLSGSR